MTRASWIQFQPLTNIVDAGPIEFVINGSSDTYLDLAQTMLHVQAKIVGANGAALDDDVPVAPVNLMLQSLFSEVDVSLNDRVITPSTNTYQYRSVFESLLSYGPAAKSSHLTSGLFYKDSAGKMDVTDPTIEDVDNRNEGLHQRFLHTKGSKLVDLIGPIHADIFFQDKLLLNGVSMKIKLHRSKDSFCLMSSTPDADYKVKIQSATLYIRRVSVNPTVALAQANTLEQTTAKYPLRRVEVKTFPISQGNQSFTRERMFLGQTPKRIVIGCVENTAINGDFKKNPYNFKHFNLNFLALYIDGEQLPWKPLKPKFVGPDSNYLMAYQTLFSGLNNLHQNSGNDISRSDYANGYTLYAFDLTPDLCSGGHFNLIRSGNVRLELAFRDPLINTVNVLVYAEYDSILEIDKSRNILIDYSS